MEALICFSYDIYVEEKLAYKLFRNKNTSPVLVGVAHRDYHINFMIVGQWLIFFFSNQPYICMFDINFSLIPPQHLEINRLDKLTDR